MSVLIEPWGMGLELSPGESCHVLLGANGDHEPSIEITDSFFIVHGGDAIYQHGEEVYDFSNQH
ncbi:MAG: hypothetical protein ABIY70_19935 [Capsulimonas sp.]|uniref:hypothetical protein n=1 Tax=Capsulimonas sp. TaxID=2494211 RepID=UPI00326600C8